MRINTSRPNKYSHQKKSSHQFNLRLKGSLVSYLYLANLDSVKYCICLEQTHDFHRNSIFCLRSIRTLLRLYFALCSAINLCLGSKLTVSSCLPPKMMSAPQVRHRIGKEPVMWQLGIGCCWRVGIFKPVPPRICRGSLPASSILLACD